MKLILPLSIIYPHLYYTAEDYSENVPADAAVDMDKMWPPIGDTVVTIGGW